MSYEKSFSRGRGRGRGGFNDGPPRQFNKYEDRSPRGEYSERGARVSRRPIGNFSRSNNRDNYRDRDDRRDSYERDVYRQRDDRRDIRERFSGRDRDYPNVRRSPPDFRRDIPRGRSISPPRKEFSMRDVDPRMREAPRIRDYDPRAKEFDPKIRDYPPRARNFDSRPRDVRRDYSPPDARERRISPQRFQNDRYDYSPPSKSFGRGDFSDRRRPEMRGPPRDNNREFRSRSPTFRPRGGRFNPARGSNRNRFDGNQRSNFNRERDDDSDVRKGRISESQKRKFEQVSSQPIVQSKKSRDGSMENSP